MPVSNPNMAGIGQTVHIDCHIVPVDDGPTVVAGYLLFVCP